MASQVQCTHSFIVCPQSYATCPYAAKNGSTHMGEQSNSAGAIPFLPPHTLPAHMSHRNAAPAPVVKGLLAASATCSSPRHPH